MLNVKDGHKGIQINHGLNGQSDLYIENPIAEQHNGYLTVVAENEKGKIESSAELRIHTNLKKPEFTKKPQDHEIEEGVESVKFSAIVNGTPMPQVNWYLNEVPIPFSGVKFDTKDGKTSIRIYNPKIEQVCLLIKFIFN